LLSVEEAEVERLHVARLEPRDIVRVLNEASGTRRWDVKRVLSTLERVRAKYARLGERELSAPNAENAHETRVRYDDIIRELRADLERVPRETRYAPMRSRMLETLAKVERMRDEALNAYGIGSRTEGTNTFGGFVYVSHLRDGEVLNARNANGEQRRERETRVLDIVGENANATRVPGAEVENAKRETRTEQE
jgi:hypothetical protein